MAASAPSMIKSAIKHGPNLVKRGVNAVKGLKAPKSPTINPKDMSVRNSKTGV